MVQNQTIEGHTSNDNWVCLHSHLFYSISLPHWKCNEHLRASWQKVSNIHQHQEWSFFIYITHNLVIFQFFGMNNPPYHSVYKSKAFLFENVASHQKAWANPLWGFSLCRKERLSCYASYGAIRGPEVNFL